MITTADNTINAIISPVRTISAKVELYEGSTLIRTFRYNDALISYNVERLGEESKFFGFGICQKANVKLIDINRELDITTAHSLKIAVAADTDYIYPHPTFFVSEVHRDENTNQLSITAYDLIYGASNYTVNDIIQSRATFSLRLEDYLLSFSYSVLDFAYGCAAIIGANDLLIQGVGETETCFDTYYENGANFGGEEKIREALNDIAEATQTIYYMDNQDNIVFKRLDKDGLPVLTITKSDYITLDSATNRRLGGICSATELGNNISATTVASGTMQYVRENAFWNLRGDVATLVDNALAAVGGLTIAQFDCDWRGNFLLEIGDKIELITKDDESCISYLLNDTITYDGGMSQKTSWQYTDTSDDESSPTSLGDVLNLTFAKVDKVNREIEIVASKADINASNLAQIKMTTNDIVATVEEVKKGTSSALEGINSDLETLTNRVDATVTPENVKLIVQSELDNGVSSVTTSTGFTFNETGLTVNKSDSEMSTQISEDGMTVYRDDTSVLVANNEGVDATNLRATTYLIIGDNSRFEDYDNKSRTGCFWIGG